VLIEQPTDAAISTQLGDYRNLLVDCLELLIISVDLVGKASRVALRRLSKNPQHLLLHLFLLSLLSNSLVFQSCIVEGGSCHASSAHARSIYLRSCGTLDLVLALLLVGMSLGSSGGSLRAEHFGPTMVAGLIISVVEILLRRLQGSGIVLQI